MGMLASSVDQHLIPAGKLYFDSYDSATFTYAGERYIGLTPGFTVSIAGTKVQSFSSEGGTRVLAKEVMIQTTRTGSITARQASLENLADFIIGEISQYIQAATPVTDEELDVLPDRYYQLGKTVANPSGARTVSSVVVTAGDDAVDWSDATEVEVGDLVKEVTYIGAQHFFICTVAGTTDGTEPTWITTAPGAETADGATVRWEYMGVLNPVLNTDYTLDVALARIYVKPGRSHPTQPSPWYVDYTPAANTRNRVESSALREVRGALRFIAFPIGDGVPNDLYAPMCTLTPNGDAVFKADDPKFLELKWDVAFTDGPNGEPALTIDGRPY